MTVVIQSVGSFAIKELSGDGRTVILVGRALPYRPFNLRTSQRVELSWYPGNPEATATVLGAKEEPTTIEGMWKDKFIGSEVPVSEIVGADVVPRSLFPITSNDIPVDSVRQAVVLFDDIVRQGQLLEVTWDEQTRHGHITDFDKRWNNIHDLAWSISFSWISRGEPTVPVVLTTVTSLTDTAGTLTTLDADLQNEALSQSQSLPTSPTHQNTLGAVLGAISTAVGAIRSVTRNLNKRVGTPFDTARRIASSCTQIVGFIGDLEVFLAAQPVMGGFDSFTPMSQQTAQHRLAAAANTRKLLGLAQRLRLAALDRRSSLLVQVEKDLLGVYPARQDDDLRYVAEIYYGSPFEWRQIMIFNDLSSPRLYAGQLVLVPRRQQNAGRRRA